MSAAFAQWALAQSVQIAVLFALVAIVDALIARRCSVKLRAALWAAVFVKLCCPPDLVSPVSIARLFDGALAARDFALASDSARPRSDSLARFFFGAWVIGVVVSVAFVVWRARRARTEWIATARTAPREVDALAAVLARRIGLARPPRIAARDELDGAAAVGVFDPVVVVPAHLLEPGARRALEHVLLHELAHVRRRDAVRGMLWTMARCVYWFHPLVHVAAQRATLVRELACDELAAARSHGGAGAYRRTLLESARSLLRASPAVSTFGATDAAILVRLDRLARPRTSRRVDVLACTAFAVLCACCVPLGSATAVVPVMPGLDEVQGCMRKRYLVMYAIAHSHTNGAEERQ